MAGSSKIPLVMQVLAAKKKWPGLILRPIVPHIELKWPRCPPWGHADARLQMPGRPQEEPDQCQSTMFMSFRV